MKQVFRATGLGLLLGLAALLVASAAIGALKESEDTRTVTYPNASTATAACAGKDARVGFGGFKTNTTAPLGSGPNAFPYALKPAGADVDRWQASTFTRFAPTTAKVTSYAYCFKGAKPKLARHTETLQPSSFDDPVPISSSCSGNSTLIGGGYEAKNPPAPNEDTGVLLPITLERGADAKTMQVSFINDYDTPIDVTVIAVCGKGKAPKPVANTVKIARAKKKSVAANCNGNDEVVFAGFELEYSEFSGDASFPTGLERPKPSQVKLTAISSNVSDSMVDATAIAYCR